MTDTPDTPGPAMTDAFVRAVAAGILDDAARLAKNATEMMAGRRFGFLVQNAEDELRFVANVLRQYLS